MAKGERMIFVGEDFRIASGRDYGYFPGVVTESVYLAVMKNNGHVNNARPAPSSWRIDPFMVHMLRARVERKINCAPFAQVEGAYPIEQADRMKEAALDRGIAFDPVEESGGTVVSLARKVVEVPEGHRYVKAVVEQKPENGKNPFDAGFWRYVRDGQK